jgi:hypothetical protein
MDPVQFLWAFMMFIVGPAMFVASIVLIIRKLMHRPVSKASLTVAVLCLVLVPVWTLGFWAIGRMCRPLMFSLVVTSNTQLADNAMRQHPENEVFEVDDFRYPLCRLPFNARARHAEGVFYLTVPSGPGPKDAIVYDPAGKQDHSGHQHLDGAWWFVKHQ